MLPDRVSNPEPVTYQSGALPIALRGPASAGHTAAVCWKESQSPCISFGGADMITNDRCKISNILNSTPKIETFYLQRQIFNFHKYETPSFSLQAPNHK